MRENNTSEGTVSAKTGTSSWLENSEKFCVAPVLTAFEETRFWRDTNLLKVPP